RAGRRGGAARLAGRDVLVQRAGHSAGLHDAGVRPAVAQRSGRYVMSPVRQAPRALSDPSSRARYVSEVLALLFPETPGPATEFVLVPRASAPRLLVPLGSRRVASGAVRRYAQPATRTARIRRDLAALALRTGADRILLRDRVSAGGVDTIATHLAEVLDRELSV